LSYPPVLCIITEEDINKILLERGREMVETIIAIVGGMCGIFSVVFSIAQYKRESNGFLSEFISIASDKEFIDIKIKIYELGDCSEDEYFEQCKNIKKEISFFCNFFNNAGILVHKKRLPFWIFCEGGWGYITVKSFDILYKYIKNERDIHDKRHSNYYEELYNKIKSNNCGSVNNSV
jgi:hypothetical protein